MKQGKSRSESGFRCHWIQGCVIKKVTLWPVAQLDPPTSPVRSYSQEAAPTDWRTQLLAAPSSVSRRRHFFSSRSAKVWTESYVLPWANHAVRVVDTLEWLDVEFVPWTSRWPPLAETLWAQKWASSEKNPGMMVGRRDSGLANTKNVHLGFSQNPLT